MGTWGTGNFENDTAGDWFLSLIDKIKEDIRREVRSMQELSHGNECCDTIPCMVEMITVLGRHKFHCLCLDPNEIREWKRLFMEWWRKEIASAFFEESYRQEREQILNATFDKLIEFAEQE